MKIAVVGGGITGLTATYFLSKLGYQVSVFEKEKTLGGLTSSFKAGNWSWPLEKYYHHFFSSDKQIIALIKELNLQDKLFFKKPKTSVFVNEKSFSFDTPKDIIFFPKLNLLDKFRIAMVTVLLKLNPFWKPLEKITAYEFIQKTMGKNNFNLIWKPLLDSKFGSLASRVPSSWFWTRIKKRSFKLGYLKGGIGVLIETLAQKIKQNNGKIFLNQSVDQIKKIDNCFELAVNKEKCKFDRVIATVSPAQLLKITDGLSEKEKNKLTNLTDIGTACLILELKNSFLTDKTYWLNINDASFPFVSVVEHTNFIDKKNYCGNTILYVGGYYPSNHPFFKMTKDQLFEKFLPYLEKINPSHNLKLLTPRNPRGELLSFELFTDLHAQPIPTLNYSQNLPKIKTDISGLLWGSLHHVYPQDRGINYAILLGKKIANEVTA